MSKTQQILLTRQQVTSLANISDSTIKRAYADGELKSIKIGNPKPNRVRDNRPV